MRKTIKRLVLVIGSFLIYLAIFRPLTAFSGIIGSLFIFVPVALAGWYFELIGGILFGILGAIINLGLLNYYNIPLKFVWVGRAWPDSLIVIVIGLLAGIIQKERSNRSEIKVELRSHERFITMLGLAARDILEPQTSDDRYSYLTNNLAVIFVVDYAYITTWNESQKHMALLLSTRPLDKKSFNIVFEANKTDPSSLVIQSGYAIVISGEGSGSPMFVELAAQTSIDLPARTEISFPMIAGDYNFGVVTLGFDTPQSLSREDITYDQLVASQIALSIWTAEQDIRINKQLKEVNALSKIGFALSETEQVGIETVINLIVTSAKDLIPAAERAILHMVDDENQILVPRAVAGLDGQPKTKLNMRLGEGVAGHVVTTGNAVIIPDVTIDSRFVIQKNQVKYRSMVVVPIKGNERVLGTISIYSDRPNVFTEGDNRLLVSLGTQAAIAIENANLLETTQQDLKEMNILYHISQNLAGSLDPEQLMMDVINILQQSFGFYYIQLFILDRQSGELVAHHGSGKVASNYKDQGYRVALGDGVIGHVAETGDPFITNDVDDYAMFTRDISLPGTRSELTVPIKARDQILGVLDIQEYSENRFSSRQLKLMTAVAEQLSVALQKADLYNGLQNSLQQEKETRTQLIQSERLATVGRLLASVSHELNNPLQAIQNALYLIKEEEMLSQQGQQDMGIILSETERMASLIGRLRNAYRNPQTEDFRPVDINDIIEDVSALTATHMRHKNIVFRFYPDSDLPLIPAIPDQIRQIALNLFINAIDAMEFGGDFIVRSQHMPDQKKVMLSFADTGIGISTEIFPRIFEPFVSDKENGTGLGLTITYDLVNQHQGEIKVEDNPPHGAKFTVWLPTERTA